MSTKLHNKDGSLTAYAFACGYIERTEKDNVRLDLWKEGCFHVRKHNFNTGERVFWESFDSLSAARKFYKQEKKKFKK